MKGRAIYRIEGFWERFDQACYDRNITKKELARRIGCNRKTLYEGTNSGTPNALYIARACNVLNISSDWLLGVKV